MVDDVGLAVGVALDRRLLDLATVVEVDDQDDDRHDRQHRHDENQGTIGHPFDFGLRVRFFHCGLLRQQMWARIGQDSMYQLTLIL